MGASEILQAVMLQKNYKMINEGTNFQNKFILMVNVLKIRTVNLNFEKENTKNSVREVTNFAKGCN